MLLLLLLDQIPAVDRVGIIRRAAMRRSATAAQDAAAAAAASVVVVDGGQMRVAHPDRHVSQLHEHLDLHSFNFFPRAEGQERSPEKIKRI